MLSLLISQNCLMEFHQCVCSVLKTEILKFYRNFSKKVVGWGARFEVGLLVIEKVQAHS